MQHRSPLRSELPVAAMLLLSLPVPVRAALPTVTIVEGQSTVVSGAAAVLAVPGLQLNPCDVVHTGPQGLVQVEIEGAGAIVLGPGSRLVVDVPHPGEAVSAPHFLISGWAKLTVPKREKAPPHVIDTPHFGLSSDAAVAVLRVAADDAEFFVEQGAAVALVPAGPSVARVAVAAGRTYSRRSGADRGAVVDRARPSFVKDMPHAFRDSLPSLLAKLKGRTVQARPATGYNAADAEAWLKAEPRLRSCVGDVTVRNAQQALESHGFGPGPIDGIVGPRTQAALRAYQRKQGLTPSGRLDAETLRALDVADRR